jgi:PTS system mannose-specific IIA component
MIGIVVATHGLLGQALVDTAIEVVKKHGPLQVMGIVRGDSTSDYENSLRAAVQEVQHGSGVVILTDMFGGTPSNIGMTLHDVGKVELLTGVNLPMLIKALQLSVGHKRLDQVAAELQVAAHRSIAVASKVLAREPVILVEEQ